MEDEYEQDNIFFFIFLMRFSYDYCDANYGKILKHINSDIDAASKTNYETELGSSYDRNIEPYLKHFKEVMKKFTKEHTGLDVDFKFSVLDPTEVLKSIRPYV